MLAKAPHRKRAPAYLEASGAVPTTSKADGALGFAITTTRKITGTVAAQWWIAEQDATPVARGASKLAGAAPDLSQATAAVVRSAASLRAVLTPDDAAISRASASVVRLDTMVEAMRRNGQLQEFNTQYQRGRAAALTKSRLHELRPCNEAAQGRAGPHAAIRQTDQRRVRRSGPVTSPETRQLQESGRARFRRRCSSAKCCQDVAPAIFGPQIAS
jgi:hypothetical protein